jgi:hypothetical protein
MPATERDRIQNFESYRDFVEFPSDGLPASAEDQLILAWANRIVRRWQTIGEYMSEPCGSQEQSAVKLDIGLMRNRDLREQLRLPVRESAVGTICVVSRAADE